MKKILLFILAIGLGFAVTAQTQRLEPVSTKAPNAERLMEAPVSNAANVSNDQAADQSHKSASNLNASFVKMGTAGNAYSTAFNGRTYLWADPMLNSVVFTHRMTGGTEVEGNSRVAYDFTIDGGATWTNDNQIYTPTGPDPGTGYPQDAGRYPMGAILNPEGNTDPLSAYYTYFMCTLNGENNNWGGYAYGSAPHGTTNSSQVNLNSGGDTWRLIPASFHITQQGVAWYMDESTQDEAGTYVYNGNIIVGKGEMVDGEIEYTETLVGFLEAEEAFNDFKMAFAPDGQTGYIVAMSETVSDPVDQTNYHPVLLKTEDGGDSWSDPIQVQLGGEDGIENIKNYIPDSIVLLLDAYADWDGDRNTLIFNMGFHVDLAVDAMGNPYMIGMVSLGSDDGNWYPGLGTEWAIYSEDGGETWNADALWDHYWFDGTVGDLPTYNRPQISIDYEGHNLFYSWLDSEAEQAEENDRPNIYLMGYDIEDGAYTDVVNVTYFTQAWNKAFFGSQSYYVFKLGPESFEIPFNYTEFTEPDVPTAPVNYWYINDFVLTPVDVPEFDDSKTSFVVGQNYPNPASHTTEILVTADTDLPIELTISNMLGQIVHRDGVNSRAHAHSFSVNVTDLDPGLYLYSVKIGNQSVTKKMLVE